MKQLTLNQADRVVMQQPTRDGDGVNISRIAGTQLNALLDPFLLVDEINSDDASDYVGGFPLHPHRGFQTFTYMREGTFHHKDSMGNTGKVGPGGVQWMSAASGIIHSEFPEPAGTKLHGFQIWINLPAAEKMNLPNYRDIEASDIGTIRPVTGVTVHPLAGTATIDDAVIEGALPASLSKATVLSIELEPGAVITAILPIQHQSNVLVFEGEVGELGRGQLAHFAARSEDRVLQLEAGAKGGKLLFLSGQPMAEPIAQYGPFVMNTMEEVEQALRDYRDGVLVLDAQSIA